MRVFLTLTFLLGAATSAAVVVIPGDATVEGTEIRLGEIAELRGVDTSLRERLATLSLGRAAAPARERVFSGSTLRRRIHAVHPALHVEVPDQVHVHTAFREITPDFVRSHVERAIRHRMPWSDAAVSFSAWTRRRKRSSPRKCTTTRCAASAAANGSGSLHAAKLTAASDNGILCRIARSRCERTKSGVISRNAVWTCT